MPAVFRRRALSGIAAALLGAGCAVPAAQTAPPPAGGATIPGGGELPAGWTFGTSEHLALWYHGLSFVLPPLDSGTLPIYDAAERARALAAARRAGVARTPLEAAADSIAHEFAGSSSYDRLQFLPLYFENADALFNAIRVWQQAEGNAQAAGSQQEAQAVTLLSSMFDTPRLRRWVVEFARVLQQEREAYYDAYWRTREPELTRLAAAAGREWASLEPGLAPLLRYSQATAGQALLTPSLAAEGRTVSLSQGYQRSAVGTGGARPSGADVAYELLHELMYSLVTPVVRDNVAPSLLRDLGEDAVSSRAAVRAGALALERLVPARAAAYREFYLGEAGRTGSGQGALEAAYPLPPGLAAALPVAVDQALAGM